jgi:uncharacterized membrane protein (UPF0182 family)
MYLLLLLVLIVTSLGLAMRGVSHRRRALTVLGTIGLVATVGVFSVLSLWGEALWFAALGYARRFWLFIGTQAACALIGAAAGAAGVFALNLAPRRRRPQLAWWPEIAGGLGGAVIGAGGWQTALVYLNRVPTAIDDPIWGLDTGFYLFSLPFFDLLHDLVIWIALVAVASVLLAFYWPEPGKENRIASDSRRSGLDGPLFVASFVLALAIGIGMLLAAFHLLYSEAGVVTGPGWTDVHIRLPAYLVLSVLIPVLVGLAFWPRLRKRAAARAAPFAQFRSEALLAGCVTWAAAIGAWIVLGGLLPWLSQQLWVQPNEITLERPYIANNIEFTRAGFDLQDVEESQFTLAGSMTRETIDENENLISELRLWDWRALDAVYEQFQEIRLYYEFMDVDIDRYMLGDRYREVMVSTREVAQENLPAPSQTFVNRRFKYTHGYGLTLATVSDFTPSGLPNLLVKDIPPASQYSELEIERPEIYYGELTHEPVVANTSELEFDYPSGEENVYAHYEGGGGVQLRNLWRKFVFGWKFDGTSFLLSTYPQPSSRVMFHRQIRERAQYIAPFLAFDEDPYVTIVDGRLYWILDAYTHSDRFPYSTPFDVDEFGEAEYRATTTSLGNLGGSNYVRNAVKVVIDAYEGSVDFYVFEEQDPIIRVWRNVFPGMFHDARDMPPALRRHVRYPQGLLLTQGLVYAKYHMSDPAVFYNQEDLWVRATERHYDRVQPVEPYYVMWELPGSNETEFVLMLPFTPKDRQVLVGWIAGLSDDENYGRFLAYKFPKEQRVLGPQQVETKIDQDRFLSGQLTLWDQRGSNVIRGNVLAIPLDGSLLYVEPIYLQAETAAYPELRVVVVMEGDNMSYGDTLADALQGLFEGETGISATPATQSYAQLGRQANEAFERYLTAQGDGRFVDAARALERLEALLARMPSQTSPGEGARQ